MFIRRRLTICTERLSFNNKNFPYVIFEQFNHEKSSSGRSRFCLAGSGTNEFSAFTLENSKGRPQAKTFTMLFFMIPTVPSS